MVSTSSPRYWAASLTFRSRLPIGPFNITAALSLLNTFLLLAINYFLEVRGMSSGAIRRDRFLGLQSQARRLWLGLAWGGLGLGSNYVRTVVAAARRGRLESTYTDLFLARGRRPASLYAPLGG